MLPTLAHGDWSDPRLTERERMALRYTDAFWHDHRRVDGQMIDALLAQFAPAELIEVAVLIAQFTGMGQLFAVLGIPNPTPRIQQQD